MNRKIEKRIKYSAILICAGLAVQAITLLGIHPLAFVVFLGVGCPLIFGGIVLYLTSLVAPAEAAQSQAAGNRAR